MKHAGPAALDRLETTLRRLRKRRALKEKSRGVFYRGGRAFLHFHEHGDALFADVRFGGDFERLCVSSVAERTALVARIDASLFDGTVSTGR
jgi:hypothetical protein